MHTLDFERKKIKWGGKKSCVPSEKNRVNRDRRIMCTLDFINWLFTWSWMCDIIWFFMLYTLDLVHMILNVLYTWLCKKTDQVRGEKSCVPNEKNLVNRDRQNHVYTWCFLMILHLIYSSTLHLITTLDLPYTWLLSSVAIECIGIVRMNQVYGQWSTLDLFGPTLDLSSVEPVFHRWDVVFNRSILYYSS